MTTRFYRIMDAEVEAEFFYLPSLLELSVQSESKNSHHRSHKLAEMLFNCSVIC